MLEFIKFNTKRSKVTAEEWRKFRKIWQELFEPHNTSSNELSNKRLAPLLNSYRSRYNRSGLFIFSSLAFGAGLFHIFNEKSDDSIAKLDDENKEKKAFTFSFDNHILSSIKSALNNRFNAFTYSNTLLAKEIENSKDVKFRVFFFFNLRFSIKLILIRKMKKSIIITPRQKLFFQFASVEYDGTPYMTPQDFLESVTEDHPRRIFNLNLSLT